MGDFDDSDKCKDTPSPRTPTTPTYPYFLGPTPPTTLPFPPLPTTLSFPTPPTTLPFPPPPYPSYNPYDRGYSFMTQQPTLHVMYWYGKLHCTLCIGMATYIVKLTKNTYIHQLLFWMNMILDSNLHCTLCIGMAIRYFSIWAMMIVLL